MWGERLPGDAGALEAKGMGGESGWDKEGDAWLVWFRELGGKSRMGAESNEKCGMGEI